MNEIEQWNEALENLWKKYSEGGCSNYAQIRIHAGRLAKLQTQLEKRVAQWLSKLTQLGEDLLRQLVNQLRKNPQIWKRVLSLLRRAVRFVPGLGPIITLILFIYDWYTGGFWHAVKSAIVGFNSLGQLPTSQGKLSVAWRWNTRAISLLHIRC